MNSLISKILILFAFSGVIYFGFRSTDNTSVKIAIINDIHFEKYYSPIANNANCRRENNLLNPEVGVPVAHLGRYYCDSAPCMIETMLAKLAHDHNVDVLIMAGDFTSHDIATKSNDTKVIEHHYSVLKEIYTLLFDGYIKNFFGS